MTSEKMKEILDAICGSDDHNLPKANVVCLYEIWSEKGARRVADTYFNTSIISISQNAGYVMVDFKFSSKSNIDFRMTYDLLENFLYKPVECNENELPMISFTLVPDEYDGECYVVALNPIMWCLSADSPDETELNHLRVVFNEKDFVIYNRADE